MRTSQELSALLDRLDGRGYPAYRDLAGSWQLPLPGASRAIAELMVDRVQPDPFAAPSRLRLRLPLEVTGLPRWAVQSPLRRIATGDYLARRFQEAIRTQHRGRTEGSGRSGAIDIDAGGAEILDRTALRVTEDVVEVRFTAGLPAQGRRILGTAARQLLLERIPRIAAESLLPGAWNPRDLQAHIVAAEDHAWLQAELPRLGLVAFVADGAILPRESGVSERPLRGAIPWQSPSELAVEVNLPGAGRVRGTGIPEGVTLIVGGGYHGKSTLLRALVRGVYPHIPGDGREQVVTRDDAWKLRAEDGRRVVGVDISPFISRLPGGTDTTRFNTEAASGSTSMAANLVEALEAGCRLLLVDEDTAASNFLVRDARMQALVPKAIEPITPLIDQVRPLYRDLGVSTIMVVGGAGDYLDVADHVILMEHYRPRVVTERARQVAAQLPSRRQPEAPEPLRLPTPRWIDPASVDPYRGGRQKVKATDLDELVVGWERVDLSAVEGLVDPSQTRAIGAAILYALKQGLFERLPLPDALAEALKVADTGGLERWVRGEPVGNLARPRLLELSAALCRLRTLAVRPGPEHPRPNDNNPKGRRPGS
ncbi:MAG TPA: ABC-ATPase domain-containing protein [Symbiobacteriaceae bacterium]